MDNRSTGITLGVIAAVVIVGGVVALAAGRLIGNVLIRAGAVAGAVALVMPSLGRMKRGSLWLLGGAVAIALIRPGLIWVTLLIFLAVVVTKGRSRVGQPPRSG